jgi:hypothetical protein
LIPKASNTDEQIYIDPEGWYAVTLPAEWRSDGSHSPFYGEDGFFETGYIPDRMYMHRVLDVCEWLANVDMKAAYYVSAFTTMRRGCQLHSLPDVTPSSILEVIENPSADFPLRFLFIRADAEHSADIISSFVWLRPVGDYNAPRFQDADLRPEDLSFWEDTGTLPSGIGVTEYDLPPEAQGADPAEEIFLKLIPPEVRLETSHSPGKYNPVSQETINETIQPFGYKLRDGVERGYTDLYKNGVLVLQNIYRLPDVYNLSTVQGDRLVFVVHTSKDPELSFYAPDNAESYLVQNEEITFWEDGPVNPMLTGGVAIWVDSELLIMGLGDHTDVQVRNVRHDLVFTFETYFGTHIPIKRFQAWNDHWILGVSDFLVQDGQILNELYGFEAIFDWRLIDDKPFFFFRKGPRVGISYNGQFLPVYYHEIVHGYCCGLAANNPRSYENAVSFFAQRDGIWKYVIMEVE